VRACCRSGCRVGRRRPRPRAARWCGVDRRHQTARRPVRSSNPRHRREPPPGAHRQTSRHRRGQGRPGDQLNIDCCGASRACYFQQLGAAVDGRFPASRHRENLGLVITRLGDDTVVKAPRLAWRGGSGGPTGKPQAGPGPRGLHADCHQQPSTQPQQRRACPGQGRDGGHLGGGWSRVGPAAAHRRSGTASARNSCRAAPKRVRTIASVFRRRWPARG
jgi:hypothetical protein